MGEIVNGRFEPDTKQEILDRLILVADDYWDEKINTDEQAIIRVLYEPVAEYFYQIQTDLREILNDSQLEFASGKALDFLVELIGLERKPALPATGRVTFTRSEPADVDYVIPKNTTIQTDSIEPIGFFTTEKKILNKGDTEVTVDAEAIESGKQGNIGPEVVSIITTNLPGAGSVLNRGSFTGGEEQETDENLRARAKDELNGGMKATPNALLNEMKRVEGVKSVSIFINDESTDNTSIGGLPGHHFELVVEGGDDAAVGDRIVDTKAVADGVFSGSHGSSVTVETRLSNGQPYTVTFSRPEIYRPTIDVTVQTDPDKYSGDSFIKNSIIRYVGGQLSSGDEEDGDLRVGDDLIRTKLQHAIMDVEGVKDITNLTVKREDGSVVSDNLSIPQGTVVSLNASGPNITITSE